MKRTTSSLHLRLSQLLLLPPLLSAASGCTPKPPAPQNPAVAASPAAQSAATAAPAAEATSPSASSALPPANTSAVVTPASSAGRQLEGWLAAFNSGQRSALLRHHEQHFPYAAASKDVGDIEREHGLSQGTGGFDLRRIEQQLEAHYVYAETATLVVAGLQKKQARGDYDALSDAVDFADAVRRDLLRLSRDKHLGLFLGPLPAKPDLAGSAPPRIARSGYGFGPIERLEGNVALLVLNGFPPLFESQQAAIAERLSQIADADAAIIDLRRNNGGFPPTGLRLASYFFDAQPVHLTSVYRCDTNETHELWTERELPGQRFGSKRPLYILVGPGTFSGGEALAYQLQALGRAVVVGEGTRGGAHPTQPYPVEGGFVLRVPWGRSVSPITGTNWEGIGVVPDVEIPEEEALETAHRLALERLGRE